MYCCAYHVVRLPYGNLACNGPLHCRKRIHIQVMFTCNQTWQCATPYMQFWLVVWLPFFFIFPYIGNNHPNWLSYFSEGWPNHQPELIFPLTHPFRPRGLAAISPVGSSWLTWSHPCLAGATDTTSLRGERWVFLGWSVYHWMNSHEPTRNEDGIQLRTICRYIRK